MNNFERFTIAKLSLECMAEYKIWKDSSYLARATAELAVVGGDEVGRLGAVGQKVVVLLEPNLLQENDVKRMRAERLSLNFWPFCINEVAPWSPHYIGDQRHLSLKVQNFEFDIIVPLRQQYIECRITHCMLL